MSIFKGQIQDAELEIMHILWRADQPVALIDLRHELSARCGWEDSTIKTLLRRLCEKKAVRLVRRGMYSAIVSEDEYNCWSTKYYVGKVFQGSAKKLVASLVSTGQLCKEDIAELYAMFNEEE